MGLSQDKFGELFGCTKSNISCWETGKHLPTYGQLCEVSIKSGIPLPDDNLYKIANMINIDVASLTKEKIELIKLAVSVDNNSVEQAKRMLSALAPEPLVPKMPDNDPAA